MNKLFLSILFLAVTSTSVFALGGGDSIHRKSSGVTTGSSPSFNDLTVTGDLNVTGDGTHTIFANLTGTGPKEGIAFTTTVDLTSGDAIGVKIDCIDTASPGSLHCLSIQIDGVEKYYFDETGTLGVVGDLTLDPSTGDVALGSGTNNMSLRINHSEFSRLGNYSPQHKSAAVGLQSGGGTGTAGNRFYAMGLDGNSTDPTGWGLSNSSGDFLFNSFYSGSIKTIWGATAASQDVFFNGAVDVTGNLAVGAGASINTTYPNISSIATFGNLSGSFQVFRVDTGPEGTIIANRGDLAIGINGNNEGALWQKHIGDGNNTDWEKVPVSHYGDMHVHDNISTTVITTTNAPHMIANRFTVGLLQNFSFVAGSTGVITAFAEYSTVVAGATLVTDATHGLATGDNISIVGTTDYNSVFTVTVVTADTFYIIDTFTNTQTGTWTEGDYLVADVGAAGNYLLTQSLFATSAGANKKFEFEVYINDATAEVAECKRHFSTATDLGACGGNGLVSISDGDRVSYAVFNLTDTVNITMEHIAVVITSL